MRVNVGGSFMRIHVIRSPDDGGWYAEVWWELTGKTEHTTRVYPTDEQSRKAALRWIRRQLRG
jgi:hypothetical protein